MTHLLKDPLYQRRSSWLCERAVSQLSIREKTTF